MCKGLLYVSAYYYTFNRPDVQACVNASEHACMHTATFVQGSAIVSAYYDTCNRPDVQACVYASEHACMHHMCMLAEGDTLSASLEYADTIIWYFLTGTK
jgi:hypothetical protein